MELLSICLVLLCTIFHTDLKISESKENKKGI